MTREEAKELLEKARSLEIFVNDFSEQYEKQQWQLAELRTKLRKLNIMLDNFRGETI